jgi:hypothetical protein
MISAADRRISDGFPIRAAMMKSAGEQLTGQASLHGLSSQYSQRESSVWSCAMDMMSGSILFSSMVYLYFRAYEFESIIQYLITTNIEALALELVNIWYPEASR